jgi:hypothetical protein
VEAVVREEDDNDDDADIDADKDEDVDESEDDDEDTDEDVGAEGKSATSAQSWRNMTPECES